MRFLLLLYGSPLCEAGTARVRPDFADYRRELTRAGVLLAFDALAPVARVEFSPGGRPRVEDPPGPEPETRLTAYFLIQAKSNEEALEWAKRCPLATLRASVEVRQVLATVF